MMMIPAPSRAEVRERLSGLLSGRFSREDVSRWALQWVTAWDPGIKDEVVWRALTRLGGADAGAGPNEYVYFEPDFHAWLDELENAMDEA